MRQQIVTNGLPLLEAELVNRVAYTEASISGLTPTISEPRGSAAKEIAAVAAEIDSAMSQHDKAIALRA
jgi:chromosome partitioning protein